jgi:N-formylglutamate deformylase
LIEPSGPRAPIVAHIPHSSTRIPDEFRRQILLDDLALKRELLWLTDWHTDRLFYGMGHLGATSLVNRLSRLVVDPERFPNDVDEPNAARGHGAVYTRTIDGSELRHLSAEERKTLMDQVYVPYHSALAEVVDGVLAEFDTCIVLDCHSFASIALPSEADQSAVRPDICIGTDPFHTPPGMARWLKDAFVAEGFRVQRNRPFSGALVPRAYYRTDHRVSAVMIEVRRGLYCDETTGVALPVLGAVQRAITRAVATVLV